MIKVNYKKIIFTFSIIVITFGILIGSIDGKQVNKAQNIEVVENRVIEKVNYIENSYKKGASVGYLTIPRLEIYNEEIIYSVDGKELVNKISTAGYSGGWNMFGDKGPSTIGAHNYELFEELPSMQIGDIINVENDRGVYTYEVMDTMIFYNAKNDWEKDVYEKSEDYSATLMTCYPIEKKSTEDMFIIFTRLIGGKIFE